MYDVTIRKDMCTEVARGLEGIREVIKFIEACTSHPLDGMCSIDVRIRKEANAQQHHRGDR